MIYFDSISMNWSEFINDLLEHDLRLSSTEVESLTGIKYQVVDRWKRGEVGKPHRNTIKRLEDGLHIKIDDRDTENITYKKLTQQKEEAEFTDQLEVKSYPVLGYVYAGEPSMLEHEQVHEQTYFYYEKPKHRCFALRVNGDSMQTTLKDGDIVLVDMDIPVKDGDLVAVKLKDGSQYIKRYKDMNYAFIQLISDNHKFGDRLVDKNDIVALFKIVKGNVNF